MYQHPITVNESCNSCWVKHADSQLKQLQGKYEKQKSMKNCIYTSSNSCGEPCIYARQRRVLP